MEIKELNNEQMKRQVETLQDAYDKMVKKDKGYFQSYLDLDALQDAFITIYELTIDKRLPIENMTSYFNRCYYSNLGKIDRKQPIDQTDIFCFDETMINHSMVSKVERHIYNERLALIYNRLNKWLKRSRNGQYLTKRERKNYKTIFTMRFVKGFKHDKIAKLTNRKQQNINRTINKLKGFILNQKIKETFNIDLAMTRNHETLQGYPLPNTNTRTKQGKANMARLSGQIVLTEREKPKVVKRKGKKDKQGNRKQYETLTFPLTETLIETSINRAVFTRQYYQWLIDGCFLTLRLHEQPQPFFVEYSKRLIDQYKQCKTGLTLKPQLVCPVNHSRQNRNDFKGMRYVKQVLPNGNLAKYQGVSFPLDICFNFYKKERLIYGCLYRNGNLERQNHFDFKGINFVNRLYERNQIEIERLNNLDLEIFRPMKRKASIINLSSYITMPETTFTRQPNINLQTGQPLVTMPERKVKINNDYRLQLYCLETAKPSKRFVINRNQLTTVPKPKPKQVIATVLPRLNRGFNMVVDHAGLNQSRFQTVPLTETMNEYFKTYNRKETG